MIPSSPGSYIIAGTVSGRKKIDHAHWSETVIPDGFYFYCGSARGPGGLKARINRHLNQKAIKHWHYDYLKPYLKVKKLWWICSNLQLECIFVQLLISLEDALVTLNGFGASDCKNNCWSHLIHFQGMDSISKFNNLIKKFLIDTPELAQCKAGSSKIPNIEMEMY